MKLRIRGNSIRLRLQRSEVRRLMESGRVDASLTFPQGKIFGYSIEISNGTHTVCADCEESAIRERLPHEVAQNWALSDKVGIDESIPLPHGEFLRLLIEKDFACLKPRSSGIFEDDSDAYPNPNPRCGQPA
jgi:hypothetical protein